MGARAVIHGGGASRRGPAIDAGRTLPPRLRSWPGGASRPSSLASIGVAAGGHARSRPRPRSLRRAMDRAPLIRDASPGPGQRPPDRLATLEASPATRHAHCISRHAGHWLQERRPCPCMPQRITRGRHRHHHEPATSDVTLRPPEGQPTRDAGGWIEEQDVAHHEPTPGHAQDVLTSSSGVGRSACSRTTTSRNDLTWAARQCATVGSY